MFAAVKLDLQLALAVLGAVAAGWGISRSAAVAGWKSVAEARKERITEIEAAQGRAEEQIVTLNKRVAELEALPDLQAVQLEVRARHAEVVEALRELKESIDEISARWG